MPLEPPTAVPKRKENSILVTQCDYIRSLDRKYFDNEEDFRKRADQVRMEREAIGEGSMHSLLQPFNHPDLKQLVDLRIDVQSFMPVVVDGELKSVGRWCQGKVLRAYGGRKQPTVRNLWDPMPDVGGYRDAMEGYQELLPMKWKKDKANSWRMDVDVYIATNSTREDMNVEKVMEAEIKSDGESESEIDNESESESE